MNENLNKTNQNFDTLFEYTEKLTPIIEQLTSCVAALEARIVELEESNDA